MKSETFLDKYIQRNPAQEPVLLEAQKQWNQFIAEYERKKQLEDER